MRIFGSDRMESMLVKLGLKEDEAIVHPWINKALEKAQQKVEARNFDMRKNILKYDNVMNDQRKVVFEQRREMMAKDSLEEMIDDMREGVVDDLIAKHVPPDAYPEAWDVEGLGHAVEGAFNVALPLADWAKEEGITEEDMRERLQESRGRGLCRACREERPGGHALHRKADRPAGARSSVARASGHARPSASGGRLARHGAARPAERI